MKRTTGSQTASQTSTKRVRTKRAASKVKPKALIPRVVRTGKQAFPEQLVTTLTYSESVTYTLVLGAYTEYKFVCNGLYDPNLTGTGHQPLYFDQLIAVYNHYCVTSSTITVCPMQQNQAGALTVVLFQDDDTSTNTTTIGGAIERPGASWTQCNNQVSEMNPHALRSTWNVKDKFSGSPTGRPELTGDITANPTEITTWVIAGADQAVTNHSVLLNVKITYTATFFEQKSVTGS